MKRILTHLQHEIGRLNPPNSGLSVASSPPGVTARSAVIGSYRTVLELHDATASFADAGTDAYASISLFGFPTGVIQIFGATFDLAVTLRKEQLETATIVAAAGCTNGTSGEPVNLVLTVTGDKLGDLSPLDVNVSLNADDHDTATLVATACRQALAADENIAAVYELDGTGADIVIRDWRSDLEDATLNLDINADHEDSTATGITNDDSSVDTSFADVNSTFDSVTSMGTVATAGNALAGEEVNVIPETASPHAADSAVQVSGQSTVAEIAVIDGVVAPAGVYLNFHILDGDHDVGGSGAAEVVCNGTVTIVWSYLGAYAVPE